jgi:DNA modification methylase
MALRVTSLRADLATERPVRADQDVHFTVAVARNIVENYSGIDDWVLDPFLGYGTTAVAAVGLGRRCVGVELLESQAVLAKGRMIDGGYVVVGDSRRIGRMLTGTFQLCLTSPPYMSADRHPQNPLTGYATMDGDYKIYLSELADTFRQVGDLLHAGGHLVINVADTGREGATPLVADIADRVATHLSLVQHVPVSWDEAPLGIVNDTMLVFQKQ